AAARSAVRPCHADDPRAARFGRTAVRPAGGGKARAVRSRCARRARPPGDALARRGAAAGHVLHSIPPPLHRLLYRVADTVRRRGGKSRRPRRSGVRVAAVGDADRLLLVRHSYGPPGWALPGGAVDRHEEPAAAAMRGFGEELGWPIV